MVEIGWCWFCWRGVSVLVTELVCFAFMIGLMQLILLPCFFVVSGSLG